MGGTSRFAVMQHRHSMGQTRTLYPSQWQRPQYFTFQPLQAPQILLFFPQSLRIHHDFFLPRGHPVHS